MACAYPCGPSFPVAFIVVLTWSYSISNDEHKDENHTAVTQPEELILGKGKGREENEN